MGIIAFLIIGLIAGLLARMVTPGRQPMGLFGTLVLGMVGSLLGGFLGSLIRSDGNFAAIRPSGIIASTIGAIILLAIGHVATRKPLT